jgi:hypothetical protein
MEHEVWSARAGAKGDRRAQATDEQTGDATFAEDVKGRIGGRPLRRSDGNQTSVKPEARPDASSARRRRPHAILLFMLRQ